jgi:hypothetical protein
LTRRGLAAPLLQQALKLVRVDQHRIDLKHIATAVADQLAVERKRLSEARDVGL